MFYKGVAKGGPGVPVMFDTVSPPPPLKNPGYAPVLNVNFTDICLYLYHLSFESLVSINLCHCLDNKLYLLLFFNFRDKPSLFQCIALRLYIKKLRSNSLTVATAIHRSTMLSKVINYSYNYFNNYTSNKSCHAYVYSLRSWRFGVRFELNH